MVGLTAQRACAARRERSRHATAWPVSLVVSPTQARRGFIAAAVAVACAVVVTGVEVTPGRGLAGEIAAQTSLADRIRALLDAEDVEGAVALALTRPPESRASVANWISTEARVEAEMGIRMPADTICVPAYVPARDGSGRHLLAPQEGCTVNATAAGGMRMVHFMRAYLANGTTLPVHVPRHGRHQHGALPHVGLFTPVAGIVHGGELYPARDAVECRPVVRGSPARNCSIGGVWRVYGSRAEAQAAWHRRDVASHAAQRAKFGLPMLRTNGVVDAATEAAIEAGSVEVKTGADGKRFLQSNGVSGQAVGWGRPA